MTFRRGAVATALLGATGCAVSVEPAGTIASVSPPAAFNDIPFALTVVGGPFRAAYEIDSANGNGGVDTKAYALALRPSAGGAQPTDGEIWSKSVTWKDGEDLEDLDQLVAQVPAGVATGTYDVEVHDPRGNTIPLPNGFTSLGPDTDVPIVTVTYPPENLLLAAQTEQNFGFTADDGKGWIAAMRWQARTDAETIAEGDCPVSSDPNLVLCLATVKLPQAATRPLDVIHLDVTVVDRAGQSVRKGVNFSFAPRPTLIGDCSPNNGPATGGTIVTITGTNFVGTLPGEAPETGTQILLRDELVRTVIPQLGSTGSTQLLVRVPPHAAGAVTLQLFNGQHTSPPACTFTYLPRPVVRKVTPGSGPISGGTRVAITGGHFPAGAKVMLVGQVEGELLCPQRISDSRFEGVMPPGTGTVEFVVDAGIPGQSLAYPGFVYDEAAPPLDPGPPPCSAGSAP